MGNEQGHLKQKGALFFLNVYRSEFMRQFLLYGHVLSTEEAELYADYELKKNPPTLDNFKEQVCFTIHLTIISCIQYMELVSVNTVSGLFLFGQCL